MARPTALRSPSCGRGGGLPVGAQEIPGASASRQWPMPGRTTPALFRSRDDRTPADAGYGVGLKDSSSSSVRTRA